jgi:hypothetical protein
MIRNDSKALQQRPEINSAELGEARRELAEMLNKVSREDEFGDVIDLLAEMVRDGALGFRWESVDGRPIRIWYAQRAEPYVDRPLSLLQEACAAIAELFINGELVFAIFPSSPQAVHWRKNFISK